MNRIAYFFSVLCENLWELVQLNLIFLLSCVPVITSGPAVFALCACYTDMMKKRRRDEPVLPRYFAAFRSGFQSTVLWGLILLAGTAILGLALVWYGSLAMTSWIYVPLTALSLLGMLFWQGLFAHFFFLLAGDSSEKKDAQLKTAAVHVLVSIKATALCLTAAWLLLAAQLLLFPATVPLILSLGLSVPGLIVAAACVRPDEPAL